MELNLAEKSVIVTGAGSNIGRGIALAFAGEKARVAIVDIDEAQARKVASLAEEAGASKAIAVRCDVTNWADVQKMASIVEQSFGSIDVLVNNVGWTVDRLFVDKPREEWEREVQLNLWGAINCTRAVVDNMLSRRAGAVVSIGSDAGRMGEYREAVYGACKAGIIALSKSLAREMGSKGLRFNVVCPGTTLPDSEEEIGSVSLWNTDIMKKMNTAEMRERIAKAYPLRRVGRPQDVASAVLFLASDAASFVTGQTLSVSGGYSMM